MKLTAIIVGIFIISIFVELHLVKSNVFKSDKYECTSNVPSIQMYYYIQKYADKYDIPLDYAYAVAYQETKYGGPLDIKYNPAQTSYAGAVGPMQIMPGTAKWMMGRTISSAELRTNLELNVEISMKLLRHLYDQYHNWKLVFGAYNTGRPMVNQYAINVYNKQYHWKKQI